MNAATIHFTQRKSGQMLPIFRLRLRNGASIGPILLKQIWSLAIGSDDVGVCRDAVRQGSASIHHSYIVTALNAPTDVAIIESRFRRLLQDRLSAAHVEVSRLV